MNNNNNLDSGKGGKPKIAFLIVLLVTFLGVAMTMVQRVSSFNWLALKLMSSSFFVAIAVFAFVFKLRDNSPKSVLVLLAAVFGIAGDLLLEYVFILGMLSFLIDHVLLIVVFFMISKPRVRDIVVFAIMALPFGILLGLYDNLGNMAVPVVVYAIAIVAMTSKAISITIDRGISLELSFCLGFGAMMFLVSDTILSMGIFSTFEFKDELNAYIMLTYVLGQCLLAASILYIGKDSLGVGRASSADNTSSTSNKDNKDSENSTSSESGTDNIGKISSESGTSNIDKASNMDNIISASGGDKD